MYAGNTVYSVEIPGEDHPALEIKGGVSGDEIVFTIGAQRADQTGTCASAPNCELNLTTAQLPVWEVCFPLIFR
jgi:hypothetical protein